MTTHKHRIHKPNRPAPPGHPATGGDVSSELRRLTNRDRWLLDLLHEHQVFSTEQIAALAFDTAHTARIRLNLLHCQRSRVPPRWRPPNVPAGGRRVSPPAARFVPSRGHGSPRLLVSSGVSPPSR
jgi:hypothetical protein